MRATRVASSAHTLLTRLRADHAEWSAYLGLVRLALEEAQAPVWRAAVPVPNAERDACLLAGTTVRIPERAATRWVRAVADAAAEQTPAARPLAEAIRRGRLDATRVLEAALSGGEAALAPLGADVEVDGDALPALASLIAMPLRRACAAAWAERIPPSWLGRDCPICGAWPALAEIRGLENSRRLRCGWCGADWQGEWLKCVFCANDDHNRLGTLVLPERNDMRRIDVCHVCQGYVKTLTVLSPTPPDEVLLQDLATLVLDVTAIAQGFRRPAPRPQRPPRVCAAPSRLATLLGASR